MGKGGLIRREKKFKCECWHDQTGSGGFKTIYDGSRLRTNQRSDI